MAKSGTVSTVYEPQEDSYLLEKEVKRYACGDVLEIGTGSGIQAIAAAQNRKVKKVLAVDINPAAIAHCRKKIKDKKSSFRISDLFSKVGKKKFDSIIFNPPYLPDDPRDEDIALDGGKKGYEITERFLNSVNDYLKKNGKILLLFSSLTNKKKIDEIIASNLLTSALLSSQNISFEELFVYKIEKTAILRELENKGMTQVHKFAKGHRGFIFTALKKAKNGKRIKIAIKMQRPDSPAKGTVNREAITLKKINKKGIGPRLFLTGKDYFCYSFIEGEFIEDFLEDASIADAKEVFMQVLQQCFILDSLKISKEEMHHPYKHVIVSRKKQSKKQQGKKRKRTKSKKSDLIITLLDFERATYTLRPNNVTQFCQYISSNKITHILKKKHKTMMLIKKLFIIRLAQSYKKEYSKKRFNDIVNAI